VAGAREAVAAAMTERHRLSGVWAQSSPCVKPRGIRNGTV
jgi:hypothetical protein